ncbi:nmra-like family domain-containing protein [Plakobranchus ocellatus]|uniref:Nmra-like family domain-containing protein n=1 Tax=Plakobranchus ocellatus TaxID=259542 RepID=A0AAV4A0Q4_9GAST|nr:nmra-like family domain-containing protein [Plakobranchus ocellatus]
MFNYESVLDAMTDIDAVFFSTTYWDTMRVDCEYDQGCNVVKAAMATGIKHLLYVGTPYCSLYSGGKCKYLLGKEKVEAHIVSCGQETGNIVRASGLVNTLDVSGLQSRTVLLCGLLAVRELSGVIMQVENSATEFSTPFSYQFKQEFCQ